MRDVNRAFKLSLEIAAELGGDWEAWINDDQDGDYYPGAVNHGNRDIFVWRENPQYCGARCGVRTEYKFEVWEGGGETPGMALNQLRDRLLAAATAAAQAYGAAANDANSLGEPMREVEKMIEERNGEWR